MLNILFEHKIIFFIILAVILINAVCLVVLIIKERKADKEEIEGIVNELMDAKPREKTIQVPIHESEDLDKTVVIEPIKDDRADISSMLNAMQKDLKAKEEEDSVANFEAEQEEKSIISYQELINSLKNKDQVSKIQKVESVPVIDIENTDDVPVIDIEDKIDAPVIEIDDEVEPIKKMIENKDSFDSNNVVKKKFKTTEFISPVYGKMENTSEYPVIKNNRHEMVEKVSEPIRSREEYRNNISLEESLDLQPLSDEIKKNDDFLNALKDFRKNLQ